MPPSSGRTTSTVRSESCASGCPSRALAGVARNPRATRKPPNTRPTATTPDTSHGFCDEPLADGATSHLVGVAKPEGGGDPGGAGRPRGDPHPAALGGGWVDSKGRLTASASIKHEEGLMHAPC